MDKLALEAMVFCKAEKIIKDLYGTFSKDESQRDKPDAAIFLNGNILDRIGIEITTASSFEKQRYMKDHKYGKEEELERIQFALKNGRRKDNRPHKKISEEKKHNFIFQAIRKKAEKYDSYKTKGFKEVILLIFEDYAERSLSDYHKEWTNYFLSLHDFPFERVIYVGENTCIIYESHKKNLVQPNRDKSQELGFTHMNTGFILVDEDASLGAMLEEEPVVPIRSNKKNN